MRLAAFRVSNHYHLVIETLQANLVAGMQWLQGTFANRFNRFRNERGHVFQGCYKAILVEENRSLLGLIDYIHQSQIVQEEMARLEKNDEMTLSDRKGADWKVKIARRLFASGDTASNPWIAQRLNMGHPSRVSNLINGKIFKF